MLLTRMIVGLVPGVASARFDWRKPDPGAERIYLSLGTSLAAGTQADELGDNILFTDESYTDQLYKALRRWKAPRLQHVKLGCPGETVATMRDGSLCGPFYPAGNQLDQAKAVLANEDVALVTIDLGANDFLQAEPKILACGTDQACIFGIVSTIAADVGGVVKELREVAPDVPVVAMNYYNPTLAAWVGYYSGIPGQQTPSPEIALQSNALSMLGNTLLEETYAALGVKGVDVVAAYRGADERDRDGDGVPNNVEVICWLTYMCPEAEKAAPNIHPTKRGYAVIAWKFYWAVRGLRLK